jgi:hypothetical protein
MSLWKKKFLCHYGKKKFFMMSLASSLWKKKFMICERNVKIRNLYIDFNDKKINYRHVLLSKLD